MSALVDGPGAAGLGLWPLLVQAQQAALAPLATVWGSPITALELLACVLSVAMVVCNARLNVMGWPLAIAASLLYAVLFHDSRLYGEAALQAVFIVAAAWGWWQWLRGRRADGTPLRVRRLSLRQRWLAVWTLALAWPLLGWWLDAATDSDVPYFDALPTVGSLLGQYLLGRKWLDTWPTWLLVNIISVALFASKGLWLTTVLYALFAGMSVWGWRAWLAHERASHVTTAPSLP